MDRGALGLSSRKPWEDDFWTPELLWKDQPAFVLASGPSLTRKTCERLRSLNTIAVNATAATIARDAAVWFFTDNGIFEKYRALIDAWPGLVVTLSRAAKREMPGKVKRVRGEWMSDFPPLRSPGIRQGRSSGQTAVSVAYALGAKPIYLLGFDMDFVGGREHHHEEYSGPRDAGLYAREFVPAFAGWHAQALERGVPILNATPGSALKEFPFVSLDEVLQCAA